MRHKIPDDMKKADMTLSIDIELHKLMKKYLSENNIKNTSKYIESLVRNDLEQRGENVKKEF